MSIDTQAQLETELVQKIDQVIDRLVFSEFSDEDAQAFAEAVKVFLKYVDLKQYILDALYDKIKSLSGIVKPHDKSRYESFRKVIRLILRLQEKDLQDLIETFLIKDKKTDLFFVLLEEKISLGQNTELAERAFLFALDAGTECDLVVIDRLLSLVQKNRTYVARTLLNSKLISHQAAFQKFLSACLKADVPELPSIISLLLEAFRGDQSAYMNTIKLIIANRQDFTHSVLKNEKWNCCQTENGMWVFTAHLLKNCGSDIELIKNYCQFLEQDNPEEFFSFENAYISSATPDDLIAYARFVPQANKRRILRHLVDLNGQNNNHEKSLVAFIKYFPEYGSLLPML